MVSAYLELAELQALNRKPMDMNDWIARLDNFITMTGNELLQNAGTVSHQQALKRQLKNITNLKNNIETRLQR